MLKLKLPQNVFDRIVQQARDAAPIEACGILAGRNGAVQKLYEMTNTDQSRVHYLMKPEEQFQVVKDMRAADLTMVAIYHSHPETRAYPSQEDIKMALTPDVVYIIISLQDPQTPDLKGFLIENGKVNETIIDIIPS